MAAVIKTTQEDHIARAAPQYLPTLEVDFSYRLRIKVIHSSEKKQSEETSEENVKLLESWVRSLKWDLFQVLKNKWENWNAIQHGNGSDKNVGSEFQLYNVSAMDSFLGTLESRVVVTEERMGSSESRRIIVYTVWRKRKWNSRHWSTEGFHTVVVGTRNTYVQTYKLCTLNIGVFFFMYVYVCLHVSGHT